MVDDPHRPSSNSSPSVTGDTGGGDKTPGRPSLGAHESFHRRAIDRPVREMVAKMNLAEGIDLSSVMSNIDSAFDASKIVLHYPVGKIVMTGHFIPDDVMDMQRDRNKIEAHIQSIYMDYDVSRQMAALTKRIEKYNARLRYLKRYHRIGAMMRRKGRRYRNVKPGQYAMYRGHWAYVFMVDAEIGVGLSMWRGIKTKIIRRDQVQAVKDKP